MNITVVKAMAIMNITVSIATLPFLPVVYKKYRYLSGAPCVLGTMVQMLAYV
jgi:hypothetical protein